MRWVGEGIVAALVVVLILPLMLLPQRAAGWVARRYGDLAHVGYGLGRRTGVINLRRAFGARNRELGGG